MTRPLTGIRADQKQSYYSIEHAANMLRRELSLRPLDQFDALMFFDQILPEMSVKSRSGEIALREVLDECSSEGCTRWNSDESVMEVVLSGETYALLRHGHVRARSTVAHEIGHARLHTDQIIRLGGMSLISQVAFHRERNPHEACQDTEWQANAFGSALLMPAEGVERLFGRLGRESANTLTEHYCVSLESATYRIGTYRRALGLR